MIGSMVLSLIVFETSFSAPCPDFTAKDINGVEYTLSKLIAAKKYVAFDFVTKE
jgi:hypothetical protein